MIPALLKALRPHQWTKNLAVLLGIFFAIGQRIVGPEVTGPALILVAAFCLASSSVYLLNDVRDRHEDARHPTKRQRPIASGQVSVPLALLTAGLLGATAFGILWLAAAWMAPVDPVAASLALATYLTLNVAYTALLKEIAIVDVSCVALGFLIRVVSGPAFVNVEVSSWLILCTYFGALFLAIAKRRGELFSTAGTDGGRKVLAQYNAQILDLLLGVAASATLLTYSLYTVSERTVGMLGTRNLLYTVPIVVLGIGRYLVLLYRKKEGEDPAALLATDRGILLSVVAWLSVAGAVILLAPGQG